MRARERGGSRATSKTGFGRQSQQSCRFHSPPPCWDACARLASGQGRKAGGRREDLPPHLRPPRELGAGGSCTGPTFPCSKAASKHCSGGGSCIWSGTPGLRPSCCRGGICPHRAWGSDPSTQGAFKAAGRQPWPRPPPQPLAGFLFPPAVTSAAPSKAPPRGGGAATTTAHMRHSPARRSSAPHPGGGRSSCSGSPIALRTHRQVEEGVGAEPPPRRRPD